MALFESLAKLPKAADNFVHPVNSVDAERGITRMAAASGDGNPLHEGALVLSNRSHTGRFANKANRRHGNIVGGQETRTVHRAFLIRAADEYDRALQRPGIQSRRDTCAQSQKPLHVGAAQPKQMTVADRGRIGIDAP